MTRDMHDQRLVPEEQDGPDDWSFEHGDKHCSEHDVRYNRISFDQIEDGPELTKTVVIDTMPEDPEWDPWRGQPTELSSFETKSPYEYITYEKADMILRALLEDCLAVSTKKRREYTEQSTNALENFDRSAAGLGLTPEQVLWVHLDKHLSALRAHSVDMKLDRAEDLYGRFVDAVNYLSLLLCMFKRRGRIRG